MVDRSETHKTLHFDFRLPVDLQTKVLRCIEVGLVASVYRGSPILQLIWVGRYKLLLGGIV